jgi:hypothetical protein
LWLLRGMLPGIVTSSLYQMSAGPSILRLSTLSRECYKWSMCWVCCESRVLLRTTTPDVNTIGLSASDQGLLVDFVRTAKNFVCPSFVTALMTYNISRVSTPSCPSEVGLARDTSLPL